MFTYKNKSNQNQVIPGVGAVDAGGTIDSEFAIENPNFELVSGGASPSVVATEAPQPNAVVNPVKVSDTTNNEMGIV